jgi:feruloyl-CoA synthase
MFDDGNDPAELPGLFRRAARAGRLATLESHMGRVCQLCIALFGGGTLYIDDGRPLPGRVEETVRNLREVAPLLYSSVPKGYEELLPWLRRDRTLRLNFFSRVRILQYSGASLVQEVRDEVDQLAVDTTGERIQWVPMLGSTEAGLMTLCRDAEVGRHGGLGMPAPNVTLRLVPNDGQMELRVRSPCVTPGYWRLPDLTSSAFDEDGFLRTGDALDWTDASDRRSGFRYRGRIAEDFKLATGTWVRVGVLRSVLLQHLAPEVRDVVIAGENRSYIAVLAIPATNEAVADTGLQERVRAKLKALAQQNGGSAQRVMRLALLTQPLSIDAGEVTDKGGLNQRSILRRHSALVEQLFAERPGAHIICADTDARARSRNTIFSISSRAKKSA